MTDTFFCPRGPGEGSPFKHPFDGRAHWRGDDTCSYCGSLNPDVFMAHLEAGDIELGPTDKSYKVYVESKNGDDFRQEYRACPPNADCKGPDNCEHWTSRPVKQTKFYFQHLSEAQRTRFIELVNAKKVSIGYPGYFYVLPFFCAAVGRAA